MEERPNALLLKFPGTNCDFETARALEASGFSTQILPIAGFKTENLEAVNLVVLSGGFSYGDYVMAGRLAQLETERRVDADTMLSYLPETHRSRLPVRITAGSDGFEQGEAGANEKEMLYKVLFDLKGELDDLKRVVLDIMNKGGQISHEDQVAVKRAFSEDEISNLPVKFDGNSVHDVIEVEPSLSLIASEKERIIKALDKHKNKRKLAAAELGISERTLYRKIKEYDLK